ncbi:MAG: RNA 2',3'-cyclic phosphodiesterase [Candidatus Zixiibacteriota bacterium]|nr:MAG: RNA 2',3'-cyclic phosphodiesterase [candidate division Zixibacteria bacterium]
MRLFIAMPLPANIEESLGKAIFILKQKGAKVKWVAPKNIHLTLKFLGEVDEARVADISRAIEKVAGNYGKIESTIDRLGAFPTMNRPRVIWSGLSGQIETMARISSEVENEMAALGFKKEDRPFKSHLTLGRVKDSFKLGDLVEAIKAYQFIPEPVTFDRIVLFKSTLTPRGPIYDRLYEAKLKA